MSCCCDWVWSFLYSAASRDEDDDDVITEPTTCLDKVALAVGRSDPWPATLYLEDNYGHVIELPWNGVDRWSLAPGETITIQGPVNTCTGVSAGINIVCYWSVSSNGFNIGSLSGSDTFFINSVGTSLRVENGKSYDPIDITFSTLVRRIVGGVATCNPSDAVPLGFTQTELRLYE